MTVKPEVQKAAVKEAGVSFETLVRRYAAAGHSRTETAHLLGYNSKSYFINLCDRMGWTALFLIGPQSSGWKQAAKDRRGIDTPAKARARKK